MNKKQLFPIVLALTAAVLSACGGANPTPTPIPTPRTVATLAPAVSKSANTASGSGLETRSNSGGSVTVDIKPESLKVDEPVVFDVAMNTHSVDLSDDMTKISLLRDDAGKEYKPTGWDGPAGGGHHRSGTLRFPALAGKPKSVELIIKGLAGVPERVFQWDLP